ncbi:MAG: HAMP domain-containing histidine kinase [Microbacteriaceae bacterium]|nr:HAMP domain-containing histidine kinase [Microbacteriaceae bacterium]MCL2794887.1 HAMP domain-containing histidine kinase [Microbacteriaceae bacterium]
MLDLIRRRFGFRRLEGFGSPDDADGQAVRRAAWSITRQITLASCAIVVVIIALAIGALVFQSQAKEIAEAHSRATGEAFVDTKEAIVSLVAIGIGTIVLAAAVSWFISRNAVRPLGRALSIQRAFVADASHELRTPLAVLDARIQALQHRSAARPPSADDLGALREDARALIDIVNELLAIADARTDRLEQDVPDARAVASDIAANLSLLAQKRDIRISVGGAAGLGVRMGETALRRCLLALVDNAVGHSYDGGTVTVTVRGDRGDVVVDVQDHGPGIRGLAVARVFDRFVHADADDEAGLPRHSGFGIGLALVRDLAVRHGGSVEVASTSPEGTVFRLTLPRARSIDLMEGMR